MTTPNGDIPQAVTSGNDISPENRIRTGIVTTSTSSSFIVDVGGGLVENPGVLNGMRPDVGTTVALIWQNASWLCLGTIPILANTALSTYGQQLGFSLTTSAQTTTSGSYVDIANPAGLIYPKRYPNTRLRIDLAISLFSTVANTNTSFAVRVGPYLTGPNVITTIFNFFINPASTHLPISGFTYVTAPAGSIDVHAQWARLSGTGTLTIDLNDWIAMSVEEVP